MVAGNGEEGVGGEVGEGEGLEGRHRAVLRSGKIMETERSPPHENVSFAARS